MMANLGLKTPNCDYSSSHSSNCNIQVSTRRRNGALMDTILGLVVHCIVHVDKRYLKVNYYVLSVLRPRVMC